MNRSKLVAIITGAISIILAIAYLVIVQLLDFRGEMLPAPPSQLGQSPLAIAYILPNNLVANVQGKTPFSDLKNS